MNIVLFCHPAFLPSQSMPRFANMLKSAYEKEGHSVVCWSPRARLFKLLPRGRLSKWAGYFDQYVLFPQWVRRTLRQTPHNTIFVFCDQALGPWVPLVRDRAHVVHAHDLLALRSALGDIPENPTSLTGRIYQRYIRRGFRHAQHFIATSAKTRDDLESFGGIAPERVTVVHNGLNYPYAPMDSSVAATTLERADMTLPPGGMLLHVGGQQWYKNLPGVIAIFAEYARRVRDPLTLWCVSPAPNAATRKQLERVPAHARVVLFRNLDQSTLHAAYSSARVFLFPSLAEGFGWPLIEAQACGCPVITTDAAPMNEVAGPAASYLPRLNLNDDMTVWAARGADLLQRLLDESVELRDERVAAGRQWSNRFSMPSTIAKYLAVYTRVAAADAVGALA